jgi:hypothetical protein
MSRSDVDQFARRGPARRAWRVPYAIRLLLAALFAVAIAFATSYALRRLNF